MTTQGQGSAKSSCRWKSGVWWVSKIIRWITRVKQCRVKARHKEPRQLLVTHSLTGTIYVVDCSVHSIRGLDFGGRPGAIPRHRVACGRRRVFHVVTVGVAIIRHGDNHGNTVVRAMLGSIVIRGNPRLAYLVGRVSTSVAEVHGSNSRSRHLASHTYHAAPREHRRVAGAASLRKPYLLWEYEENRHKGVHFA